MKYRYYCFKCGNSETIKYPQGQVVCPICGEVMVFQETEMDE